MKENGSIQSKGVESKVCGFKGQKYPRWSAANVAVCFHVRV